MVAELTWVVGRERMVPAYFQGGQGLADVVALVGLYTFGRIKGSMPSSTTSSTLKPAAPNHNAVPSTTRPSCFSDR